MRVPGVSSAVSASVLVIGLVAIPVGWAGASGSAVRPASAPGTTLYVEFNGVCSDSGPGTQAEPFCTVQAAANVVDPGQTVDISAANLTNDPQLVTITRSGTPTEPITFAWPGSGFQPALGLEATGGAAVTLQGVHDVTLSRLKIFSDGADNGIDIVGSSDISVDGVTIGNSQTTTATGLADISIDGTSSGVTIARTLFVGRAQNGVLSATGAAQVTLTDSAFVRQFGTGVDLHGTTGAVVTGNTIITACNGGIAANGVTFADGTSGTVENNVLEPQTYGSCTIAPAVGLSVDASSAASAGGVTADYNALDPLSTAKTEYTWAGTGYTDPASFNAATGQGAHDVTLPAPVTRVPPEGSPAIDSANCSAPSEQATDIIGAPRVSDPLAPDASLGNGSCHADRGAYELQDSLPVTFTTPPLDSAGYPAGAAPFTFPLTVTSAATSPWNEPVSYTVDFGDGSGASAAAPGTTVSHQYPVAGQYTITVAATDTGGSSAHATYAVYALPAQPPQADLTAAPDGLHGHFGISPDTADFTASLGSASWEVASKTISYGGAGSAFPPSDPAVTWSYVYDHPGTYTAVMTVTDKLGRLSTVKSSITVGDALQQVFRKTVYSNVVAAHSVVKLGRSTLVEGDSFSPGALVDVMVSAATKPGYVTVYPDGTPRPATATVQFQAGRDAENSALTNGTTDFYNGSAAPVQLDIVTYGLVEIMTGAGGSYGSTYVPVTPARVLAPTKIGGGHQVAFRVSGLAHVPASVDSVVLDITVSRGTQDGVYWTYWNSQDGAANPLPSGLWSKGQQVTNLATVPTGGIKAVVANMSNGPAYFSAYVVGYYVYLGSDSVFLPAAPHRLATVTIAARHSVKLPVSGRNGIPAKGTTAVAVNLTASRATAAGIVTAYADGTALPGLISLSYAPGAAIANAAIVAVGSDGAIRLYNGGTKPVTLTVDLTGSYYGYGG
jgi:hypothetical protein